MARDTDVIEKYMFTGCAPPFHFGVFVSGHFNDLATVAFTRIRPAKVTVENVSSKSKDEKLELLSSTHGFH